MWISPLPETCHVHQTLTFLELQLLQRFLDSQRKSCFPLSIPTADSRSLLKAFGTLITKKKEKKKKRPWRFQWDSWQRCGASFLSCPSSSFSSSSVSSKVPLLHSIFPRMILLLCVTSNLSNRLLSSSGGYSSAGTSHHRDWKLGYCDRAMACPCDVDILLRSTVQLLSLNCLLWRLGVGGSSGG